MSKEELVALLIRIYEVSTEAQLVISPALRADIEEALKAEGCL